MLLFASVETWLSFLLLQIYSPFPAIYSSLNLSLSLSLSLSYLPHISFSIFPSTFLILWVFNPFPLTYS